MLVGNKDGTLLIIDIGAGEILEVIEAHTEELWSVAMLPDQVCCVYSRINHVTYIPTRNFTIFSYVCKLSTVS